MDAFFGIGILGFGLAFAESGLGLGIAVPGETVVLVLAATASDPTHLLILALCVTLGASAGDHLGFALGRRFGDSLRESRAVARLGRHRYDNAMDLLRRRGASAVFLTRLVPVVRTLTPAAAGASGLPYRRFAPASLAGSALWACVYVGGGSAVGAATTAVIDALGRATWLAAVAALAVMLPLAIVRAVAGRRPLQAAPELPFLEGSLPGRVTAPQAR